MTAWFTDAWAAELVAQSGGVTGPTSLSGTVLITVTGESDGDRSVLLRFEAGRMVAADTNIDATDGPDAELTVPVTDARAILTGELDPSVAFMQGRLKVAGDMSVVLDVLATAATAPGRTARSAVADRTAL